MERSDTYGEPQLEHLQQQAAAGDESAFRKIFQFFYPRLNQFANRLVHNSEGAGEIVDEVFVKLWRKQADIAAIQHLSVYLFTATRNAAFNFIARQNTRTSTLPLAENLPVQGQEPSPEQLLITAELLDKIQAAVDALPPRCKIIFNMVRQDGLKYKEVADILQISVNTVDAQMVIAVNRIRDSVKGHVDFPSPNKNRKNILLLLGSILATTVFGG